DQPIRARALLDCDVLRSRFRRTHRPARPRHRRGRMPLRAGARRRAYPPALRSILRLPQAAAGGGERRLGPSRPIFPFFVLPDPAVSSAGCWTEGAWMMTGVMGVTGAGRGIGRAIAAEAAREGYAVCINYLRSREPAEALAADIRRGNGKAIAIGA